MYFNITFNGTNRFFFRIVHRCHLFSIRFRVCCFDILHEKSCPRFIEGGGRRGSIALCKKTHFFSTTTTEIIIIIVYRTEYYYLYETVEQARVFLSRKQGHGGRVTPRGVNYDFCREKLSHTNGRCYYCAYHCGTHRTVIFFFKTLFFFLFLNDRREVEKKIHTHACTL